MVEITCEPAKTCDASQEILKGTFLEGLAQITVVAPYTSSKILPWLQGSATAAAKTCTGGSSNLCGANWYEKTYDDNGSIENQVAALGLFTSNLVAFNSHAPATQSTASNSTVTTSGNGTTTSSGAAAATKTGSSAANVLASSSVGITAAMLAAIIALF